MQYRIRQVKLVTAFVAALLGGALAQSAEDTMAGKVDARPSTPGEWQTAFVGHVYDGVPASEAQVRQDSMGRFLKSLGLERLWQVTGDQHLQEGWYSAALGVTVITKATTGSSASLTARVMDGQVTSPALSAAGQ